MLPKITAAQFTCVGIPSTATLCRGKKPPPPQHMTWMPLGAAELTLNFPHSSIPGKGKKQKLETPAADADRAMTGVTGESLGPH